MCCCYASVNNASANNYNDDGHGHGDCHSCRRFASCSDNIDSDSDIGANFNRRGSCECYIECGSAFVHQRECG